MTTIQRMLRAGTVQKDRALPRLTLEDEFYVALLAEYCLTADVSDPESVLMGEEFTIDNVDFRLIREPKAHPHLLFVWCDFGPTPKAEELDCYRALLEMNTSRADDYSSMMALCPETGLVVCSARLDLKNLNASVLDRYLRGLAKEATAWQRQAWKPHAATDNKPQGDKAVVNPGAEPESCPPFSADFIAFLVNYCRLMRIDAVEQILLGAPLKVGGVSFVLSCGDRADPEMASLYCDYGVVPKSGDTKDLYRALLMANMTLHPATGQAMMIAPHTNHILLGQDFKPKTMKPNALQHMMETLAQGALKWQAGA